MAFGLLFCRIVKGAVRAPLWTVAGLVAGGTMAPHVRTAAWWVRVFDYPRPQLAVLALLVAAALPVVEPRRRAARTGVAAMLAAAAWQLRFIRPYTRAAARQTHSSTAARDDTADSSDAAALALLIANVQIDNRAAGRLLAAIDAHDPDVVVLLEPDTRWLAELAPLARRYPHRVLHPQADGYGIALYSRLALVDPQVQELVEPGIPSVITGVRLRSGEVVRLYAIHPRPPRPGSDSEERDAELVVVGRRAARERHPVIVAGDLNDVAWSHTTRLFQRISALLDPRVGRGFYNTFPAHLPLLRVPIDQVFHSPEFTLDRLAVLRDIGSDHFPVYVRLRVDRRAAVHQPPPQADADDHAEAEEIVADARS